MARWKLTFDARSPNDPENQLWTVGISANYYDRLIRMRHSPPFARILLLKDNLRSGTLSIFKGWNRPETDQCFVYASQPELDYQSLTIELPSKPNCLFLSFVLPDGTIDFWDWRPRREGSANLPEDVNGTLIWNKT